MTTVKPKDSKPVVVLVARERKPGTRSKSITLYDTTPTEAIERIRKLLNGPGVAPTDGRDAVPA